VNRAVLLNDVRVTLPSRAGPVAILRGCDLEAAAGEAVGLVGPSGSGKTTILMVVAGLEAVTGGVVEVAGQDLTRLNEDALARFRRDHVGIVFQAFHLIAAMTALENVAVPLEFRGLADARTIAREALDAVGLGHRVSHYPGQLSGGEQQRVAIARALAAGAQVILADEPTGNLDSTNATAIANLLTSLAFDHGKTVIAVTHDPEFARAGDRVIRIVDGRIESDG